METDEVGALPETLAADAKAVLPNQAVTVEANPTEKILMDVWCIEYWPQHITR